MRGEGGIGFALRKKITGFFRPHHLVLEERERKHIAKNIEGKNFTLLLFLPRIVHIIIYGKGGNATKRKISISVIFKLFFSGII